MIDRSNYRTVAWRLDVGEMLYIGHATREKLKSLGIKTIGDLANASDSLITSVFGKNGVKMLENARGENLDPVTSYTSSSLPESVGNGVTTPEDVKSQEEAARVIYSLGENVAFRLRGYGLKGETVAVDLRSSDLKHMSKQGKLDFPTDSADIISDFAAELVRSNYDFSAKKPLRTITLTVSGLSGAGDAMQGSLFEAEAERKEKLGRSIDNLRKKYGFGVLKRALNVSDDDRRGTDDGYIPFDRGHKKGTE